VRVFTDIFGNRITLTGERLSHFASSHPELRRQLAKIKETLSAPQKIVRSRTDVDVRLYYRFYKTTPVGSKFLCVVVKLLANEYFIITAYFTDTVKRGELLWTTKDNI
jgi:hypothetical protein